MIASAPHAGSELRLTPLAVDPAQQGCGYWLEIGPYGVLLDCGFSDPQRLDHLPRAPDLVVCSHAHWDHLQALPWLHQRYPDVPLYGTRITHRLAQGAWQDPQGDWLSFPPLRCLPFQRAAVVLPDLTLSFFPAGHLPGAAVTMLHYTGGEPARTVVYTGDFSLASMRFAEGIDLEPLRHWQPDVLLLEGTLGTDRYPSRRQAEGRLVEQLVSGAEQGGLSLLPVPDLGLGQELLFLLKTHHRFTHSDSQVQIWVDEAVAQGCALFEELLPDLPRSVQNFAQHQSLFWESRVHPWVRPLRDLDQAEAESSWPQPGIILCHAQGTEAAWRSLWSRLATVDPARPLQVILFPEVVLSLPLQTWPGDLRERLQICRSLWHSHADSSTLVQLIHTLRPQHVVFGHGHLDHLSQLADIQDLCDRYHVHCPVPLHPVDLPSAPLPIAAAELPTAQVCYEGEVSEVLVDPSIPRSAVGAIQVLLPPEITQDPRWQVWADTGVVEARWQEDQLVLRGMSAKELVKPVARKDAPEQQPARIRWDRDLSLPRCGICQFLSSAAPDQPPCCGHPASPLYRHPVDLGGQCLQFQPISMDLSEA